MLLEQLEARAGLKNVLVAWGLPAEVPRQRERLYLAGAGEFSRSGRGSLVVEAYELRLIVEVYGTGSARATDERMRAIEAELERQIEDGLPLADVVLLGLTFRAGDDDLSALPDGWLARCEPRVDVRAQLS